MKVLYLVNFAGKAGIEKYVQNLTRLLPAAVGTPYFAYGVPGQLSEKLAEAGVPSLRLSLEWKNAPRAARTLADYCRENGVEVIHAQCPRENVIALMAKKRLPSLRVVYTEHFTRRVGAAWRMLNRIFTPRDDCVIAVCQEGRDVLVANACRPDKIKVIYNGIEPRAERPRSDKLRRELGLSEDVFVISCLARFDPEKDLDMLVRALARLKELTDRPFCCCVAGDGPLMEDVRGKIAAAGLEREMILLGYRTDAADILASSDLYVCSSSRNEALSFAILEAMNSGLPLVVTDVGGNRDLAETQIVCGSVVPPGDAEAFAAAIADLMADGARREEWSAAALRKVAERFDLNKLALSVFETYEETEK
ncbi:MAG: glycosyltransferase [Oscillospiraceae bacterium]|nr:glycosyltransferase [Oscillospiraceae bacterium]